MRRDAWMRGWGAALLALGLVACEEGRAPVTADGPGGGGGAPGTTDAATPPPPAADAGPPTAQRANLRFKGGLRLRNDFAQALDLPAAEVCTELGRYDCVDAVHGVTLGGVDPYEKGLYEARPVTGVSTPLAVERMALSACGRAVDRDLAAGEGGAFGALPVQDGALTDVDADAVAATLDGLYKRALLRPVTPSEVAHLRGLYRDVAAKGGAAPARDWAVLACFTTLTSLEMVLY